MLELARAFAGRLPALTSVEQNDGVLVIRADVSSFSERLEVSSAYWQGLLLLGALADQLAANERAGVPLDPLRDVRFYLREPSGKEFDEFTGMGLAAREQDFIVLDEGGFRQALENTAAALGATVERVQFFHPLQQAILVELATDNPRELVRQFVNDHEIWNQVFTIDPDQLEGYLLAVRDAKSDDVLYIVASTGRAGSTYTVTWPEIADLLPRGPAAQDSSP